MAHPHHQHHPLPLTADHRLTWRSNRRSETERYPGCAKSDIATLGEQLASIESELRLIRGDLDDLKEQFENINGFRKEIDHALERIAAIEKHFGINKKIAA
jgi:hypothetical protein